MRETSQQEAQRRKDANTRRRARGWAGPLTRGPRPAMPERVQQPVAPGKDFGPTTTDADANDARERAVGEERNMDETCGPCGGPLYALGRMGACDDGVIVAARCRNCGMDFTVTVNAEDYARETREEE